MKTTLLSLAAIVITTLGTFGEEVEFRLISLHGEDLSENQVRALLSQAGLGLERRQVIAVEKGVFSFDDTQEVEYPTEYSEGGTVVAKEVRKLGTTISGKVIRDGDSKSLDFKFGFSGKSGDHVSKSKNGLALVTPIFSHISISGEGSVKVGGTDWCLMSIQTGRDKNVKRYLAIKIQ